MLPWLHDAVRRRRFRSSGGRRGKGRPTWFRFPCGALNLCVCWKCGESGEGRVFSKKECGYMVDLVAVNLLLRESSN
jgi:hypothetical protein